MGTKSQPMRRRTYLQSVSAALGVGLFSSTTAARIGTHSTTEQSNKLFGWSLLLRETNNWSVNKWRQYLTNYGIQVNSIDQTYLLRKTDNQDLTRQQILTQMPDRGYLTLSISYVPRDLEQSYIIKHPAIDVNWQVHIADISSFNSSTSSQDSIELRWGSENYDRKAESEYYGILVQDPSNIDVTAKTNRGIVAQYNDEQATRHLDSIEHPITIGSYFGTQLEFEMNKTLNKEKIEVFYKHFSSKIGLNWEVADGAPTVNPRLPTCSWVKNISTGS